MMRLREHGLTPERVRDTPESELQDLIYPVGFYRQKSKHIKLAAEVLLDKYDGDIPPTYKVSMRIS